MKTPRLIPVVIAATAALLLFKGIGLITTGSYVLTGTTVAVAQEHGGAAPTADANAEPTMALPHEATMEDTAPTLADTAETLPLTDPAAAHGEAAPAEGHGEAAAAEDAEGAGAGHGVDPATPDEAAAEEPGFVPQDVCPKVDPAAEAAADASGHSGEAAPAAEHAADTAVVAPNPNCIPDPGTNAHGDALALIKNSKGAIVPLDSEDAGAEPAVLERLGERRDALDSRETELNLREDLIAAAERRLDERTAALRALEDKVNALVAEKKTAEQQQFVAIVAMYEQMKPKDAATIFNQLEMPVLLKVARAMSPRKMGPILAKMDPMKAKNVTDGMAAEEPQQSAEIAEGDPNDLPQIVGQ